MRHFRLQTKMTAFSLVSRLAFTLVFIALLPFVIEHINILQTDIGLVRQREKVIKLIEDKGIEQFMLSDSIPSFGSYNILKNEFINIEKTQARSNWNFIEVTKRLIGGEVIEFRVLNYSFSVHNVSYLLEIGKSTESIKATEETTKKVILVFLILFICITVASDIIYTRYLLRPLKKIISKLKSTSSPEVFDTKQVNTSTGDFVMLDQTLNELMWRINDSFRREKEITVNISHELLTPVSIIRSKLENLLLNENIDVHIRIKIEESLTTLSRLTTLVNSLLLIARIESCQYLKDDNVKVSELLNELIDEIWPVAESKNINISGDFTNDFEFEHVNKSLLFSMFFNIINNSVKNTSGGGEIKVVSFSDESVNKVTVTDNGKGMTPEKMAKLFSRFTGKQGDEKDGTGIGLAIARSIADFHNIKIDVRSEPGKGTEFSFTIFKNS